ncbi:glutamate-1-semialdehyde 2,1-aminomutase [Salinisphaera sp. Q1T1-3]|uniref:glutamate-1-semialdehyde 2,1-aminomutase n=1 Tax=Salinisphaera sp. Q1T1-3 TaxID=2321229 RepID=UPI000E74B392|nr:glutamate-1-semialdehyde 2,1-aminomutase [Salinisphaera sp. Q1T1-3]RJS94348.1 glutamate-1-semialdehyde-2,1-aminomutase [Salinisphaera sp. Q1T1-3]
MAASHARPGPQSQQWFERAQRFTPGGVNSPARAFNGVGGGAPVFIDHAKGAWITDVDGNRYVDYVGSFGPMILGHADAQVVEAVQNQAAKGLSFGAPTGLEVQLAELITDMVDSIESVRMVNSGTEAAMTAVRLARGYTGRKKILKFAGNYHGHVDALLVNAGSGALTLGIPGSPGVPESVVADTLVATYNDLASVEEAFAQHGDDIACVMVEPVAGNMNCIPPVPGFLEGLRDQCTKHGALLVFDEVMTGFRVHPGCAQAHFGVTPDVTALGKIVGGGMPVGAVGASKAVMETLAPTGPVYQAGTLSGHPLGMAAGIATLEQIRDGSVHEQIAPRVETLRRELKARADHHGVPFMTQAAGAMFGMFFTESEAVTRFDEAAACDLDAFSRFFHGMLDNGVYLAPAAFEAAFVSRAHDDEAIEATLAAADKAFAAAAAGD